MMALIHEGKYKVYSEANAISIKISDDVELNEEDSLAFHECVSDIYANNRIKDKSKYVDKLCKGFLH